jgi:hypothetical protein
MKKLLLLLLVISFVSCYEKNGREVVEKKDFLDNNTYRIICRGWPKKGLTGQARIQSAKDAALINAQFIAKDIFESPVDPVKNGTVEKYDVMDNYVRIYYLITYQDLKKYYKE